MAVPTIITTKLAELEQLCEKYPTKIPIEECAVFLGILIFETLWSAIGNIRTKWLRRGLYAAVITILFVIWLSS